MAAGTKRDYFDRVVEELHLDIRDPLTLLLVNAMALADQRDALKAELSTHQSALEEAEGRCCPEDFGFEEWIGVLKKRDNVVAHTHLQEIVSLLLQTTVPIGPMRDRTDYPVELQRAIDFLHGRVAQSAGVALRPEVIAYAHAMQFKLDKNAKKKGWPEEDASGDRGWKSCDREFLEGKIIEEVGELLAALKTGDSAAIRYEAADVGNIAMMLADNAGALPAVVQSATAPRRCREGADRDCSPACDEKSRTYCNWKGF